MASMFKPVVPIGQRKGRPKRFQPNCGLKGVNVCVCVCLFFSREISNQKEDEFCMETRNPRGQLHGFHSVTKRVFCANGQDLLRP